METKLTLKLDQGVIRSVKKYAERRQRSLSRLVEDYFRKLISAEPDAEPEISPLVQELSGIINEGQADDADYIRYLEEKYE